MSDNFEKSSESSTPSTTQSKFLETFEEGVVPDDHDPTDPPLEPIFPPIKPIEPQPPNLPILVPRGTRYKRWTYQALQVGDCRAEPGAQFTLYEDGATEWTCELSSGDTGDEWKSSFHILDSRQIELFKTGRYYFNIGDKDHKHTWTDRRGPNPSYAAHFDKAYYVEADCAC